MAGFDPFTLVRVLAEGIAVGEPHPQAPPAARPPYGPTRICDPTMVCAEALTCVNGYRYPTTCGPANCDNPIGLCDPIDSTAPPPLEGCDKRAMWISSIAFDTEPCPDGATQVLNAAGDRCLCVPLDPSQPPYLPLTPVSVAAALEAGQLVNPTSILPGIWTLSPADRAALDAAGFRPETCQVWGTQPLNVMANPDGLPMPAQIMVQCDQTVLAVFVQDPGQGERALRRVDIVAAPSGVPTSDGPTTQPDDEVEAATSSSTPWLIAIGAVGLAALAAIALTPSDPTPSR